MPAVEGTIDPDQEEAFEDRRLRCAGSHANQELGVSWVHLRALGYSY